MNTCNRKLAARAACWLFAPALAPGAAQACATCGCTLNSDAAMGYSVQPGWRLSFEYDYIHQDELRSGTQKVSTVPDGDELERDTLNRYFTVGVDYSPSADWNIDLRLPYVARTHSTFGEYDADDGPSAPSFSRNTSLGDIKLVGSYQGVLPEHNLGLQFGVKLPTGRYGTDVKFADGPLRGEPLDASLQPGTGSTDIIVGGYYYLPVGVGFEFFANAQFQAAVAHAQNQPGDDFRPGNNTTVSFGFRYESHLDWVPQLQLNLLHKNVDTGALADITDTAGYVAYLSPGITARIAGTLHVYGFAQLPVYSDLVGYQLFPRYTFSVGASYAF